MDTSSNTGVYPMGAYQPNLHITDVSYPVKHRAKRELVPDTSKDYSYWMKRTKNNNSAKKSRWKRKCLEMALESRMTRLVQENMTLKKELKRLKEAVGESGEGTRLYTEQDYMQTKMQQSEPQYYSMVKSEYPEDIGNLNYDVFNVFHTDSGQGYGLMAEDESMRHNQLPHKLRHKVQTTRS